MKISRFTFKKIIKGRWNRLFMVKQHYKEAVSILKSPDKVQILYYSNLWEDMFNPYTNSSLRETQSLLLLK